MIDLFERILRSSGFKFTLIGLLSLLLLIPVTMIRDLISERQERSREATLEVSEKWGLPQTVTGPFITFPVPGKPSLNGESSTTERKLHLMPGRLDVTGEVVPSEKKRGIFRVVVYETSLNMTGIFNLDNDPAGLLPAGGGPDHPGYLNFGVSDLRGIREIGITVNGRVLDEVPGLFSHDLAGSGVHVRLPDEFLSAGGLNYDIRIVVAGSSELYFTPLGRTTTVDLSSTWSDPSFDGAFLPGSREISQQGFTAQWKVNELNRNYPQVWYDRDYDVSDSRFGVRFLVPVDHYQKSMRSVKYAMMFIALTFLVFLLTELVSGTRLHAVQYLLTGSALVVFYSLLIALSEHIGFNLAYLVSAAATTALIGFYTGSSTGRFRHGLVAAILLSVLYGFLFTTLQLQDYSLLFGSTGIFLVIATVMFVSRKIDWYREAKFPD